MKNNLKIFACAILAVAATVSCSKELNEVPASVTTLKLGVNNSKVVYHNNEVEWASADRIILFDTEGGKYVSEEAGADASYQKYHEFIFNDWNPEKTPAYAMFNFSATATPYENAELNGGAISAIVPSSQAIANNSSFSQYGTVSVGEVSESEGSFNVSLKNVCGVLKFQISTTDVVKYLVISSKEGIDLAGKISVSTESVKNGAPEYTVIEGEKSVKVYPGKNIATESGCFKSQTYMASILPSGTTEFTPVLYFVNKDGQVAKRTATQKVCVGRNEILDLKTIDGGTLDFKDELPAVLEIDLDFYNENNVNPLGTFAAKGDQDSTTGEEYDYSFPYVYEGIIKTSKTLPFTICKGTTDGAYYQYTTHSNTTYGDAERKVLYTFESGGWIKLPAVEERYLQSVSITIGNTNNKAWKIMTGPGEGEELYSSGSYKAAAGELATKTATFDESSGIKKGVSYYIYLNSAAKLHVYDIKLVYSVTLKPSIAISFTDTKENPFSGIQSTGTTADTAEEDDEFTLGEYKFVSVGKAGFQWSAGLWNRCGVGYLELPKISGYKLTSVYIKGGNADGKPFRFSSDTKPTIVPGGELVYLAKTNLEEGTGADAKNAKQENTWTFTDSYDPEKEYYLYASTSSCKAACMTLNYTYAELL